MLFKPPTIPLIFVLFQLLDAMNQDSGIPLTQLQVDGGMTANNLLMQLQADILNLKVGKKYLCYRARCIYYYEGHSKSSTCWIISLLWEMVRIQNFLQ